MYFLRELLKSETQRYGIDDKILESKKMHNFKRNYSSRNVDNIECGIVTETYTNCKECNHEDLLQVQYYFNYFWKF